MKSHMRGVRVERSVSDVARPVRSHAWCMTWTSSSPTSDVVRVAMLAVLGLALSGCGTRLAITSPSPSPSSADPADATPSPPPYPATATPARSAPPKPLLPPDTADVEGRVLDATSRTPVASATIRLRPFNVVLTSAADGTFAARGLPVFGRCRWMTIEVEAAGYGNLVHVDHPLYQARSHIDLHVRAEDQRSYFGPPRSQANEGEAFCSR